MRCIHRFQGLQGLVVGIGFLLTGCNSGDVTKSDTPRGEAAASAGIDFSQTVADSGLTVPEYMTHVVNNNANDLWKWQAQVRDAQGEYLSLPQNDDEWEEAESAALTLRELTKPLATIGKGNPAWDARYAALKVAIEAAAKHAEAKDGQAFFADGQKIDKACVACHHQFAPELELPPRIGG